MENELMLDNKNILTMKLIHYFITEKNYNPIILQGVENEVWLENLDAEYKVVRIVSNYIHNDEQYSFDVFKTKRIINKIKRKTFSFDMNVISIFLDLGDNVGKDINVDKKILAINIHDENDLKESTLLKKVFPDINKKLTYNEEGIELFQKITNDINKHNYEDAKKLEKLFKNKGDYITYFLIILNVIIFIVPYLLGIRNQVINEFCIHGPSIRNGDYYRIFTGIFLHADIFHIFFNCYSLYLIGSQIENFLGKTKFLLIYLFSGFMGAMFSILFGGNTASIGASGAIFGLMGALVCFGYYYRVYLGNVLKTQIIPLILFNLFLGFIIPGVDNFAHIGGLLGGILITRALGIDSKTTTFDKINGYIILTIFTVFITYLAFIYSR